MDVAGVECKDLIAAIKTIPQAGEIPVLLYTRTPVGGLHEARAALEDALAIWQRKGCLPCADRIRAQIDSPGTYRAV